MKIHHIRNATMLIEQHENVILVDPMLGNKGEASPPFAFFRFKAQRNPIVDMPISAIQIVEKATHCLITHLHPDHFDKVAEQLLKKKQTPIICSVKDSGALKKRGLNVIQTVDYWKKSEFLGGSIVGIPAKHGYGFVAKLMGNVMGFFIQNPKGKSIYLSSDTVYTPAVDKVLKQYQPDISVVACGTAQLDVFMPLLMTMDDITKFVENAPGEVIANHLEAVNHCPTTRKELKTVLSELGLIEKVTIPKDGEIIRVE